jgi:hypothetical protein
MKNLKYTFLLLALFFVQCTDLEIAPEDAFTEDEIFRDLGAYTSYLAKVYGAYSLTGQDGPNGDSDISIVNDEGFTSYIRAYWKAQELTTDEAVVAWNDAGIRDLHEHSWSSENQFVRVLYYRIALIVSIANDFLKQSSEERLDFNGITDADKEIVREYRLEVRFLRAMAMWHALDLFRNVPLETSITATPPTQAEPLELFNFIREELADIESQIAGPRQNQYGRADQAAVWMLQAKVFLNAEAMVGQNEYAACIDVCDKILSAGYTLDADYETLFMKDNHTSNEIIFALNSDGKNTQNWGCTTFLVQAAIGGAMVDTDSGVTGGWAGLRTTSTMVERFPDTTGDIDQRAIFFTDGQNMEISDIGSFTDGIAVPKWKNLNQSGQSGSDPTHVDTDYGMFRLGDTYLMYAEAMLRGGGGDMNQAVDLINELRQRAYKNDSGNISSADLDLAFILDERQRELYWEGTRRIDLVRFGEYTDQGIWPWKGNVAEGRVTESFRDIFPIPASDLLANPELVQNPGY